MEYRLFDFFEEYDPNIPESMHDGMIHKLTYSDNLTRISFYVHFPKLVPAADVFSFEQHLEKLLRIESVRIMPRYTEESFTLEYFRDILIFLKRELSVINGFLDGADIVLKGNDIHITLKNGGYDILMQYRVPDRIRSIVSDMFSKLLNVRLEGGNSVSEEAFMEMKQKAEESLPKQPVAVQSSAPKNDVKAAPAAAQATAVNAEIAGIDPDSAVLVKGRQIRDIPVSINC